MTGPTIATGTDRPPGLLITVLVSVGRHPLSGRPRPAALDARALELGLRLNAAVPGRVTLLHARDSDSDPDAGPADLAARDQALRAYLGMGSDGLTVVEAPEPALAEALAAGIAGLRPDLILTGLRAENGEDSGMLPYLLSRTLGYPLVSDLASIEPETGPGTDGLPALRLATALPRGQRRLLRAGTLPLIASVGASGPPPRQSAFARARRGVLQTRSWSPPVGPGDDPCVRVDTLSTEAWPTRPARPRPKRLRQNTSGASAAQRLAAATGVQGGGQVLQGLEAREAAEAIMAALEARAVVKSRHT